MERPAAALGPIGLQWRRKNNRTGLFHLDPGCGCLQYVRIKWFQKFRKLLAFMAFETSSMQLCGKSPRAI